MKRLFWLILVIISGCAVSKPAQPTTKYGFVKLVTLDQDGSYKTQFITQIK